jgi:hypothetical protein
MARSIVQGTLVDPVPQDGDGAVRKGRTSLRHARTERWGRAQLLDHRAVVRLSGNDRRPMVTALEQQRDRSNYKVTTAAMASGAAVSIEDGKNVL